MAIMDDVDSPKRHYGMVYYWWDSAMVYISADCRKVSRITGSFPPHPAYLHCSNVFVNVAVNFDTQIEGMRL